jgi:hypothetical protein
VSFDAPYRWDIGDEWCLTKKRLLILKVEIVRVDGVVTEPFFLSFANHIHGPSERSFGKSFLALPFRIFLPVFSGNYV